MSSPSPLASLPLEGVRVLDFSMGVAGPHAGMLLAQNGADVIKVEPREGDWVRTLGQSYGELSAHSIVYHQGKRSLAIDLKAPEGRQVAMALAARTDIIIESFRPGAMHRLGLAYEAVKALNPSVIYLSLTGFGQSGPNSGLPATDAVVQARSGLMHLNRGEDGLPRRLDMIVVDITTGLYAFQAIQTALIGRLRGGPGAFLDVSLVQSAFALQSAKILESYMQDYELRVLYSPLGVFKTRDGFISISVMRDKHFVALCEAMECTELLENPAFSNRPERIRHDWELKDILKRIFPRRTTWEWCGLLDSAGVLNSPVHSYEDCLTRTDLAENFAWFSQSGIDAPIPVAKIPGAWSDISASTSPAIGENSEEILRELGYGAAEIENLYRRSVIGKVAAGRAG